MNKFVLNNERDDLHGVVLGYVSGLFCTAGVIVAEDGHTELIDLNKTYGTSCLSEEGVAKIIDDCDKFVSILKRIHPLEYRQLEGNHSMGHPDLEELGTDFLCTRNGEGVSFSDGGKVYGDGEFVETCMEIVKGFDEIDIEDYLKTSVLKQIYGDENVQG